MAAFTYEYRVQRLYQVPAQVVGEFCEALQASEGGLTPKTFVEASRSKSAPTHCMLEWNNRIAAEKYREEQARSIIQNLRIVQEEEDGEGWQDRGFVSAPGGKSAYVTLHSALNNDEWRNHLLAEAKRDMEIFKAKYRRLTELAAVIDEMDKAIQATVD